MGEESKKCRVCGETSPEPAWFCLPRQMGEAAVGQPCSYSKEGHERMVGRLKQRIADGEDPNNSI